MCGIAGVWRLVDTPSERLEELVRRMSDALAPRGPDGSGSWIEASQSLALGHSRLKVIELSEAGHQPMVSSSGRWVVCFNGEIYNHSAMRASLEQSSDEPGGTGVQWRGSSDTETLVKAIDAWGLERALLSTVGMFALAAWDRQDQTLSLARDRFGEKPLYYGWAGKGESGAFVFGSELKALMEAEAFDRTIEGRALASYLRHLFVPSPWSIFRNVYKIEPGCLLQIIGTPTIEPPSDPIRPGQRHGTVNVKRWWSLADVVQAGAQDQVTDDTDAVGLLERTLTEAVRLQWIADVPLGAFLSGGVDSTVITALMQTQNQRPVRTFTVGFEESAFNEAPFAKAVCLHLGTEHHELFVTPKDAQAIIPQLPWMYDEPFADSSQISTHLVCMAAKRYVTVALSGDAGDELFGGYGRYLSAPKLWSTIEKIPTTGRTTLSATLRSFPVSAWDLIARNLNALIGDRASLPSGQRIHNIGLRLANCKTRDEFDLSLISEWNGQVPLLGETAVKDSVAPLARDSLPEGILLSHESLMMYRDSMVYLPDDILCKVDRAAMAVSLEIRAPFLDHRVAEVAWRFPLEMKIRQSESKWILRQILYRHIPKKLIDRSKSGFSVPIGQWLRGPLREWAEDLLDEATLKRDGLLNPAPILKVWRQHLAERHDWTSRLWGVLMFQAWMRRHRL